MVKDILVDNSVAKNFCNPLDDNYKEFIAWLFAEGVLVLTQQLLVEYHGSTAASPSPTNMVAIIAKLTSEGRLRKKSKTELAAFVIPAHVERRLLSNLKDWDSIKATMMSERKFALTLDNKLLTDINSFPRFRARAERRPEDLPYR